VVVPVSGDLLGALELLALRSSDPTMRATGIARTPGLGLTHDSQSTPDLVECQQVHV
jgi:hypothetical protein